MNKNRIIKKSEWKSWPVIAEPTATTARIRKDPATGKAWVAVRLGKRAEIKLYGLPLVEILNRP